MPRPGSTDILRRIASPAALLAALAWFAWATPSGRADMILGITTDTYTPGTMNNSLDVTLTNTGAAMAIAGFSYEITATGSYASSVNFTDATTSAASNPYIFAGNSFADNYLSSDITLTAANNSISAADLVYTPGSSITLNMGQTVSLGLVLFTLTAGAPATPISLTNITFTSYPTTSLSGPNNNNIPIGPNSVPELPPAALIVSALVLGVGFQFRGRLRRNPLSINQNC